jgi:hypothetical protein
MIVVPSLTFFLKLYSSYHYIYDTFTWGFIMVTLEGLILKIFYICLRSSSRLDTLSYLGYFVPTRVALIVSIGGE